MPQEWHQATTWVFAELGSVLLVVGGFFDYIPRVAILLAAIWYVINIYEWARKVRYRRKL